MYTNILVRIQYAPTKKSFVGDQVFDAISAAFQKMGTLMQRLGGHVTQVPSGGFFLLTWETSKSSNMWWEKWEKYGKSCRSWAQSW